MGVIIYSFNLNISPKMSYGVLECDKRSCNKKGVLFVPDPGCKEALTSGSSLAVG